jgi:hypothetical protein
MNNNERIGKNAFLKMPDVFRKCQKNKLKEFETIGGICKTLNQHERALNKLKVFARNTNTKVSNEFEII